MNWMIPRLKGMRLFACVLLPGLTTLCGCAGVAEEPAESNPEADPMVEALLLTEGTSPDGTQFKFFQTPVGDLTVELQSPVPLAALEPKSVDSGFSRLYESLALQPAPAALVAAEARAAELELLSADESETLPTLFEQGAAGDATARVGSSVQALTAGQFQQSYCPAGHDFLYCWPNTGGSPYVQRTCDYLYGAINAVNCTVRFRYRYYDDGAWYTLVDRYAAPGQYFYYWQSGSSRSRRFEVVGNPTSCGVRFAVFGDL